MAHNSYRIRYEARKQIRRLGSRSMHRRAHAREVQRALGVDGLVALHQAIDTEQDQWRNRKMNLPRMLLLLMGLTVFAVVGGLGDSIFKWNDPVSRLISHLTVPVLVCLIYSSVRSLRRPADNYHVQIVALAEIGDITSLTRLIQALDTGDNRARFSAALAISSLLPLIDPVTAAMIGTAGRSALYRQLEGDNVPFMVAILNSLTVLQDDTALPALERLAISETTAAQDPEVRAALTPVLTLIREIAARNTGKQTLLRASDVGSVFGETALRPALPVNEQNSAELLRSSTELPTAAPEEHAASSRL